MTKDFESDALHYLLDEMDPRQRVVFEDKLTRFPGARVALHNCADLLGTLRRQALDLPFFGDFVREEVALVMNTRLLPPRRSVRKVRQIVACHD